MAKFDIKDVFQKLLPNFVEVIEATDRKTTFAFDCQIHVGKRGNTKNKLATLILWGAGAVGGTMIAADGVGVGQINPLFLCSC